MGNPHCIIFSDKVSEAAVRELGPYVENADEFPHRMNLQLCKRIDRGNLISKSGSAVPDIQRRPAPESCAAAIAAYRLGYVESRVNVNQPGGMIQIDIKRGRNHLYDRKCGICRRYECGRELLLLTEGTAPPIFRCVCLDKKQPPEDFRCDFRQRSLV